MSIFPDWIEISIGGGISAFAEGLTLELVDDGLELTIENTDLVLVIEDNDLQLEVS